MNDKMIEFELLESEVIGNNTVQFKLKDGTIVKVEIKLMRAGVSTTFKNPDGSPHYNLDFANTIQIIPKDKKYLVPREALHQTFIQPINTNPDDGVR